MIGSLENKLLEQQSWHSSHAFILTTLLSRNNNLKMPSQNILAEFKNSLSYFFFQPDKLLTVSPKCSKMNF